MAEGTDLLEMVGKAATTGDAIRASIQEFIAQYTKVIDAGNHEAALVISHLNQTTYMGYIAAALTDVRDELVGVRKIAQDFEDYYKGR